MHLTLHKPGCTVAVALILTFLPGAEPTALAQGSKADYERARQMQRTVSDKVFRQNIKPMWLPGGDRFWYRVTTGPGTSEFILVDAASGKRAPAFDHARLAEAWGKITGKTVAKDRLPVDRLDFPAEVAGFVFRSEGKWWQCAVPAYELTATTHADVSVRLEPAATGPKRSGTGGAEVQIQFHNATASDITLFWLTTTGERKSFGTVAPGETRAQHTYAGHAWQVTTAGNRTLGSITAPDDDVVIEVDGDTATKANTPRRNVSRDLSPDGKWQVTFSDRNVYLRDMATRKEIELSTDGGINQKYSGPVVWSPDSSKFVVFRTKSGGERKVTMVESSPKDQVQPNVITYDYLKPGDEIPQPMPRLFDAIERRPVPVDDALFSNPWSNDRVEWSPDSKAFTFVHNQRGHQLLRVVSVDAKTGEARTVVEDQARTFVDYSQKFFLRRLPATGELIWMSERDGWNHLYLCDVAGGVVKNQITKGSWLVKEVERVDETKRQIWFSAVGIRPGQDPYYVHHARVNFDGSGLVILTAGDGTHTVDYSPDGKFLIDRWSRVDQPPVSELRRSEDGSLVCELERGEWGALQKTGWQTPERFTAKGRDGRTDIYGVIIRPSNFDPTKRYPVIENIYAGPHSAFVPKSFSTWYGMNTMAELGFIVVQIDGMGTNWRERSFHDVAWKNLKDAGFPDRIAWIKAAAAKHPEMDVSRMGIYGGSAGGQNSLAGLLHHGDFYRVGVADCGCHDNRMDKVWWNEAWMGWPVDASYADNSNVTHAGKLQGKLMLVVGELDRNVDPASTMQVANALEKADKDFDLLIVTGAGHGAAETPYGSRRRADFFVRHLLGKEPRWTN